MSNRRSPVPTEGLRYSIHHAIGFLNYKFEMFGP